VRLCRREASVVVGAALCQRFGGRDPVLGPAIASFVGSFLTLVFTEVANVFWMLDLPHVRQQLFEVVFAFRESLQHVTKILQPRSGVERYWRSRQGNAGL
jgi:hypothetical protein